MDNKVFVLLHVSKNHDHKLIGYFLDHKHIEEALIYLKQQSGFCDHPEGFTIEEYELDKVYWPDYPYPVQYSL